MARGFSKTNLSIWTDADWRALPFPAQHVYRMLWDHPSMSYCGVVDWRPARLCGLSVGLSPEILQRFLDCLRARHFLVVDETTEECLVRSWVRFDGLMSQPRLAVSFANSYAGVSSNELRGVIVDELRKLREREPNLAAWDKPQVRQVLEMQSVDAKSLDVPTDPFAEAFDFTLGAVSASVSPAIGGNVERGLARVSVAPTTATATSTYNSNVQIDSTDDVTAPTTADAVGSETDEDPFDAFWTRYPRKEAKGAAKKAFRAALKKVDDPSEIVNATRVYAVANTATGRRFIPLPGTWLNAERWLDEPPPDPQEAPDGSVYELPHVDDLETAPDGLSEEEYREWERGYRERLVAKRIARQAARR